MISTRMLDETLAYSCGYWKDATNLADAQQKKLDLICKKVGLKPGQRILDIGCGCGGFAIFAAENYGVEVIGLTISKEKQRIAHKRIKSLPIKIRLEDYRNLDKKFDHIVSVGMFEHVGPKNYRTYMETAARCLKDNGLFLLHKIGNNEPTKGGDLWIDKYIFFLQPRGSPTHTKDYS